MTRAIDMVESNCKEHACGCHGTPKFDGMDRRYMRVLWVVIAINAVMFAVEMTAGQLAGSQALPADALDLLGDTPARALHDHAFQFSFQRRQPDNAAFDLGKLRLGDRIGGSAGLVGFIREAEKVADCLQGKAQLACVPDVGQPRKGFAAVEPLVSRAAFGLGEKADLLVVADRRYHHPGRLAQFSDGQHQIPLEAVVARGMGLLVV